MSVFKAGGLQLSLNNWSKINAPEQIITWIKDGVVLKFTKEPKTHCLPNHSMTHKQEIFVSNEIDLLLQQGVIVHCDKKPTCVSPLGTVPKKGGKLRLIVDLRQLNSACKALHFSYEDISTVATLIEDDDNLITADIRQGYHHIPVHKDYQEYFGICWRGKYYKFQYLPFGFCASGYYFGKILRPVITYLRQRGVKLVCYVDDFLLMASDSNIDKHKQLLLETLYSLGWRVNFEKSSLVQSKVKNYIGYRIRTDTDKPTIEIPHDRVRKLKKDIIRVLQCKLIKARVLARIAGQCVAMFRAVAPGKLMLRSVYRLLSRRSSWDDVLQFNDSAIADLTWWLGSLDQWNSSILITGPIQAQIETDASQSGWGARYGEHKAAGFWTPSISHRSSNYRELSAILMAIKSFQSMLQGKSVQVLTDNVTAVCYINHLGGPSEDLTELMKKLWAETYRLGITLQAKHLAGYLNGPADMLSRLSAQYEWSLHPQLFHYINKLWGPHTIDRFATCINHQLPIFNSRFWDPVTSGVDALAQTDWAVHNNYVCPPFRLLPKILQVII